MVVEKTQEKSSEPVNSSTALTTTAVGSFGRPDYLTKARSAFAKGEIDRAALDKLEKQATEYWIRVQ